MIDAQCERGVKKVWGSTECLFSGPLYSRHRLEVLPGGYSSIHYHVQRANRFHVESGTIAVVVFRGWRYERVILTQDTCYDVPSLVPHQFQCIEGGTLFEDYWPDRGGQVREDDIVRLTVGGYAPIDELPGLIEVLLASEIGGK